MALFKLKQEQKKFKKGLFFPLPTQIGTKIFKVELTEEG